jgi:nitroreductase
MNLIDNLNWRYATKKYTNKIVPQEKVDYILNAARLAPSSSGLQPFQILVITNKELQEKILPITFNQNIITVASHVLVFASWEDYSLDKIESVFAHTVAERGMPEGAMDAYKTRLWDMYEPRGTEWRANHAARQAYISLGIAIAAAAEQKVDATPMEGFIPSQLDELLSLKEKGLKSQVILTLGYRDENDWLLKMKKVRTPKEAFITEMN